jgi:hypothetical protein
MKMCRPGGRVIAMAFVASLSNAIGFSVRAADLMPIVQGGGYYNWSGYYIGGNVGAGVGRTSFTAVMPGLSVSPSDEIRGFVGGGQGGFNWQFGSWVAGVEADLQFSNQRNGVTVAGTQFANTLTYFSTLRGRIGYSMDEWLFYVLRDRRRRIYRQRGLVQLSYSGWVLGFAILPAMGRGCRCRDPDLGQVDRPTRIPLPAERLHIEHARNPGRYAGGHQERARQRHPHRAQLSLLTADRGRPPVPISNSRSVRSQSMSNGADGGKHC